MVLFVFVYFLTSSLKKTHPTISKKNNSFKFFLKCEREMIMILSQPFFVFFLHNATCTEEMQQINSNLIVFSLTRLGLEPILYHIRGEHANYYTNDVFTTYKVLLQSNQFMHSSLLKNLPLIYLYLHTVPIMSATSFLK